eukprot:gene57994-biopygen51927
MVSDAAASRDGTAAWRFGTAHARFPTSSVPTSSVPRMSVPRRSVPRRFGLCFGATMKARCAVTAVAADGAAVNVHPLPFLVQRFDVLSAGPSSAGMPPALSLFFSAYIEGYNNREKAIAIYNPLPDAVSLSGYTLQIRNSYGNGWINPPISFGDTSIPSGDEYVLCTQGAATHTSAIAERCLSDDELAWDNGDDAIRLMHGSQEWDVIDSLGMILPWRVCGEGDATEDHALFRKPEVCTGVGDDWETAAVESTCQWDVATVAEGYQGLGTHTVTSCAFTATPDAPPEHAARVPVHVPGRGRADAPVKFSISHAAPIVVSDSVNVTSDDCADSLIRKAPPCDPMWRHGTGVDPSAPSAARLSNCRPFAEACRSRAAIHHCLRVCVTVPNGLQPDKAAHATRPDAEMGAEGGMGVRGRCRVFVGIAAANNRYANEGLVASTACCVCGGGSTAATASSPIGCTDLPLPSNGGAWHRWQAPIPAWGAQAGNDLTNDCAWFGDIVTRCASFGNHDANEGLVANTACCVCGGGQSTGEFEPQASRSF